VRFRVKSLRFQFKAILGSTSGGMLTYGVQDDISVGGSTTLPSNRDQVLNLRRSTENAFWRNSALSWRPLDFSKWYYVQGGSISGGDRLTVPCSLCFITTLDTTGEPEASLCGFMDVSYVIEFAGASVTTLSSTSSVVLPTRNGDTPRPSKDDDASSYVRLARPLMSNRK